jgi:pilus retraction protein PilT
MMVEKEASDLFLSANTPPRFRINGQVHMVDAEPIDREEIFEIADSLLVSEKRREIFAQSQDIDFIHIEPNIGRFRLSVFRQRGTPAIVARHVSSHIKTFEALNLPADLCRQFCQENRGLILLCGPAGNGKSTTIASMLEHINQNFEKHIVTIEDPIEFLFESKKSIIHQRELGLDVPSYPQALRHVTQQSPDIIYIGVIRDTDTMQAVMNATELGALVVSTFHTTNAIQTIERIVNFFPPYLHDEVRRQVSLILKGVIAMRLVPLKDKSGRMPACETMVVTPTISRLIREGNIKEIQRFIDEGDLFGMKSFRQALVKLVKDGHVLPEDAREFADSKDEFDLELKGIKRIQK